MISDVKVDERGQPRIADLEFKPEDFDFDCTCHCGSCCECPSYRTEELADRANQLLTHRMLQRRTGTLPDDVRKSLIEKLAYHSKVRFAKDEDLKVTDPDCYACMIALDNVMNDAMIRLYEYVGAKEAWDLEAETLWSILGHYLVRQHKVLSEFHNKRLDSLAGKKPRPPGDVN